MTLKVGDYLGDGWTVSHVAEASSVNAGGSGNQVITVTPATYVAHKRVGDTLYEQQAASEDQLKDRIDYWTSQQPNPNPLTEDGNRELSKEEKIESAKMTLMQHVTIGARPGGEADLTEKAKAPKPEAAIIQVHPNVNVQEVKGDQAAGIAAAASGTPAPAAASGPTETPAGPPKSSKSKSSK